VGLINDLCDNKILRFEIAHKIDSIFSERNTQVLNLKQHIYPLFNIIVQRQASWLEFTPRM